MNITTTRQHIVEAADDLFYRQGFAHTSFADIAKAVNISRSNFYHHFKTKDDMLDAVIQNRLNKTEQMLADWGEQDSPSFGYGLNINSACWGTKKTPMNWPCRCSPGARAWRQWGTHSTTSNTLTGK